MATGAEVSITKGFPSKWIVYKLMAFFKHLKICFAIEVVIPHPDKSRWVSYLLYFNISCKELIKLCSWERSYSVTLFFFSEGDSNDCVYSDYKDAKLDYTFKTYNGSIATYSSSILFMKLNKMLYCKHIEDKCLFFEIMETKIMKSEDRKVE